MMWLSSGVGLSNKAMKGAGPSLSFNMAGLHNKSLRAKALKSSYNRIEQMATLLAGSKMSGAVSDLMKLYLDVAQFGRALDLGSRGWGFESLHSDQLYLRPWRPTATIRAY